MTTLNYTVKFKKTVLASIIGLGLSQSCFALEALSDDSLSDTTGEGIALLPQDAYMVFRGAGANETAANVLADRSKDTGYIHMIPVGPLTQEASSKGAGKADLYMYGLALSKSDDDANSRLATTAAKAAIASWGTASNPWVLKVATQNNVPNFAQDVGTTKNTESGNVSYLALEAPLYEIGTRDAEGADAYKLKLAMWADAFQRDPNKAEFTAGGAGQNPLDAGLIARMRLQMIWNNFSINGSKIQLFQTLDGAKGQTGLSPFYDKTLGLSGVLRFNSGDSMDASVKSSNGAVRSETTLSAWTMAHDGSTDGVKATGGGCGNAGPQSTAVNYGGGCQYQVQTRQKTYTATGQWVAPTTKNILRLSTRETADYSDPTQNLYTPAVNGGGAPTFDANEGIFIYNLNANLVLGNLYQPLIVSSDGKNFTLELARIPNKEAIYKQIYTDYGYNGTVDPSYKGSTCNVYQCGTAMTLGGKTYQGSNATHSSISIGTVNHDALNNTLTADSSANAVGVSFGALQNVTGQSTSETFYDLQFRGRQKVDLGTWCSAKNWIGSCTTNTIYSAWQYRNTDGTYFTPDQQAKPSDASANSSKPESNGYATVNNRNWDYANRPWILAGGTGSNQTLVNGAAYYAGIDPAKVGIPTSNNIAAPVVNAPNNFGSAVIDGMLIQHLKITTKGL